HDVRRAAQLDVANLDLVLELPQRAVNLAFGERSEAHRRDEMLASPGQHGSDRMPCLLQQPDQLERLVCRDPAADDEEHLRHASNVAQTAAARRAARRRLRPARSPTNYDAR